LSESQVIIKHLSAISFIFISGCVVFKSRLELANPNPQFFVVGTVHRGHLNGDFMYSLADIKNIIKTIAPDVICGEVAPEAYGTPMRGYFPPEQRIVEAVASAIDAIYTPCDWRAPARDYPIQAAFPPKNQKIIDEQQAELKREIALAGAGDFALIHSAKFQMKIKSIHDEVMAFGGEAADGFWLTRNKNIVKQCLKVADQKLAKRILFVYGIDHKYAVEQELRISRPSADIEPVPILQHTELQKLNANLAEMQNFVPMTDTNFA
jgi:hypothetical protein